MKNVETEKQFHFIIKTQEEERTNAPSLPHFVFHFIGKKTDLGQYYLELSNIFWQNKYNKGQM